MFFLGTKGLFSISCCRFAWLFCSFPLWFTIQNFDYCKVQQINCWWDFKGVIFFFCSSSCLYNNGGCWEDKASNITACRDTFRGRVCECPIVQGVKFHGDGYTHCEASGALRCELNNGGCWKGTRDGRTYSACIDDHTKGCKCPSGFKGDGVTSCEVSLVKEGL